MKLKSFGNLKMGKMRIFQENKTYGHSRACDTLRPIMKIEE